MQTVYTGTRGHGWSPARRKAEPPYRWYVTTTDGKQSEIIDGPFIDQPSAERARVWHEEDGEAATSLVFVPRVEQVWKPFKASVDGYVAPRWNASAHALDQMNRARPLKPPGQK